MEHGGSSSGSAARQERTRLKNVEWTAYESVHKKYLNLDTKPKLKNHYRAHRLSFWLNLVPDLHKPGNDDVPDSHHELEADDGVGGDEAHDAGMAVKPINPPKQTPRERMGSSGYNSLNTSIVMMNLTAPATSKATSNSQSTASKAHPPNTIATDDSSEAGAGGSTQEDGFAAYSTALSVTIAIGCSLLILNVLIFAGVYYQRDKTRLNDSQHHHQHKKRSENGGGGSGGGGQMPNNICGDLVDVHNAKGDSILGHHHHQLLAHHQMPPPEFADLPQRAPPPPKHLKSHADGQMIPSHALQLLSGGGGGSVSGGLMVGTLQKKSSMKPSSQQQQTNTMTKNTNSHMMMQSNNNNNMINNNNNNNINLNAGQQMDELRV